MEVRQAVAELKKKRQEYVIALGRIDAALDALGGLDKLIPEPNKLQVQRKLPGGEKYTLENPSKVAFAVNYIRNKGKEAATNELFDAWAKATGLKTLTDVLRRKHYNNFCVQLNAHARKSKNPQLKKSTYTLQGVGREVYYNVTSAMQLQTEKTEPGQSITLIGSKIKV